jgi:hypothetical protein
LAGTPEADAFEIVASGISADGAAIRDVARAVARSDLLDRFMQRMRSRMTEEAEQAQAQAGATTPRCARATGAAAATTSGIARAE